MPNLPAVVAAKGGAIVDVLSWEQHLSLSPEAQYQLGDAIARYPQLNNEQCVDWLADMATHYGQGIDRFLIELVGQYGVEMVYFAITSLHEVGERSKDGVSDTSVEQLLVILDVCQDAGWPIQSAELLDQLADGFDGGIKELLLASPDLVLRRLKALRSSDEERLDLRVTGEDGDEPRDGGSEDEDD